MWCCCSISCMLAVVLSSASCHVSFSSTSVPTAVPLCVRECACAPQQHSSLGLALVQCAFWFGCHHCWGVLRIDLQHTHAACRLYFCTTCSVFSSQAPEFGSWLAHELLTVHAQCHVHVCYPRKSVCECVFNHCFCQQVWQSNSQGSTSLCHVY